MKRIVLLVSAALLTAACSSGGKKGNSGRPDTKGELVARESSKSFVAARPHGMVAVPGGSFVMGQADQDFTMTPEKTQLKTVTVSSFFMDETEVTNAQYRLFINYVRDSIARTLLAEAAGGGQSSGDGKGEARNYAYLSQKGAKYAEILESMYVAPDKRENNKRILDVTKLQYRYEWEDIKDGSKGLRSEKKTSIAVYPDTTVWLRDFNYAYNEPLFDQYFWHMAYKDYPVVGVTWDQARAFTDYKTKAKADSNARSKKRRYAPMRFRLPTEAEWEYAARGGLENAAYPWGGPYLMDDRACYLANFKPKRGNYIVDEKKGTYMYTAPVKKFPKNGYGLYDMAGNVAEWTESPYNNSTYQFSSTLNPYISNRAYVDVKKTVRGGSWKDIGYLLMVGSRDWERKDSARSYIGFRTVQDIPEGATKIRR